MPEILTDDGCRIHFRIRGTGPPLLMLPGLESPENHWGGLLSMLSQRFTCITVDQRGVGRSGRPTSAWTTKRMAKDAAQVLDSLGIQRAHVLGVSLGGMVAQDLAARHPQRVDKLILVSTTPGLISVPPPLEFFRDKFRDFFGPSMFLLAAPEPSPPSDGFRQLLAACTHVGVMELRKVRAPSLIIHGTKDQVTPPLNAHIMKWLIRDSRLQFIPGDHGMLYSQPRRVADLVTEFAGT